MDKIVKEMPKKGPTFRLFTEESLKKIKTCQDEIKKQKEEEENEKQEKSDDPKKTSKSSRAKANEKVIKTRPNPGLAAGKQYPEKLGEFPPEFYGKPIEDLDEYYKDKYTFMVVAKDGTMFRFSATKAFYLLSPTLPLRKGAVYILSHPFFSFFITIVILVNCVVMTIPNEIQQAEYVFIAIYTAESLIRMTARGFIVTHFTYLRDPWNWLDFFVILLGYILFAIQQGGLVASLRTFRVMRALKTIAIIPGLKIIVGALMEAVRRLRDVIILTIFMLSIFALVGLQLYQGKLLYQCQKNNTDIWKFNETGLPDICDLNGTARRCEEGYVCQYFGENPNFGYTNFDNFLWSLLSAFRLMTQDFWEGLYQMVLKANGKLHVFFFVFVIFLGSFYLVNLILAIVAMSYDDCQKREMKEAEEELAAALEEQERQIAMIEEMMNRSPSLLSEISHIAPPDHDALTPKYGRGLEPRLSFSITREGRAGSGSQPGSPFFSRRLNSQGSGTIRINTPTSPHMVLPGGSIKSPSATTGIDGVSSRPTAEELYHMLHSRTRSVRQRQYGSIRPATGTCQNLLGVNRRSTMRRSLSPAPSSVPHPRLGSGSSPSPPVPQGDSFSVVIPPASSPPFPLSPNSASPKRGLNSFKKSEKTRFSWSVADWHRSSGNRPLPELIVDEEKGEDKDHVSTPSDIQTAKGELFPYVRSISRAPSIACVDSQGIQMLRDSIYRASDGQICFEESELTFPEWVRAKINELIFDWEWPPWWQRISAALELFIMDAFVDLFITLCIITNTVFMAMDHNGIPPELSNVLIIGNYVFTAIFATEAVLKILALGIVRYLRNRWNLFDVSIVILSFVELFLTHIKGLSILRSFRLLRVFKLAKSWPTLNLLIGIIGRSINALGNLCFVLGIIVFIFAVMGMQVFGKNYTKERFAEGEVPRWNFCDFLHSFMIVFRVLCGEWIESTWDCIRCSGYHCIPFFLLTMIIGNLVVLNLFLALLLASFGAESFAQNHEVSTEPNKLQEAIDRINRVFLFVKSHTVVCCRSVFCSRMKKDGSLVRVDSAVVTVGASIGMSVAVPCSMDAFPDQLKCFAFRNYDESQFSLVIPDFHKSSSDKLNSITKSESDQIKLIPRKCDMKQDITGQVPVQKKGYLNSWSSENSVSSSSSSSSSASSDEASLSSNKTGGDADATSLELCLYPAKGTDIREVKVIYFRFPEDCCPKHWSWKYVCWDYFLRTKLGSKWWAFRCYTNNLVDHKLFESFIIVMILGSSVSLALEDIYNVQNDTLREYLECLDKIFTVAFLLEMLLKLSAYGFRRYFSEAWCWLDFLIVIISIISLAAENLDLSNMAAFRALRTLRALRPLKAVSRWEGMRVVVNALFQAIPAIFNVLLVCLVFWLIFSIMGVTLFSGRFYRCVDDTKAVVNYTEVNNKTECESRNYTWANTKVNFDNVLDSYLALFQVATFKGWTDIMKSATDLREKDEQPKSEESRYMYLYFVFFIIFGSFFTLNLFIGVIIDNFNVQKRKAGGSLDIFLTEDQKRYYNAMKKLGSKQPQRPIPKPRLKFQLFFFKLVGGQKFEIAVMLVIVANMVCLAVEHNKQSDNLKDTLNYFNSVFVAIFTLECIIKLLGLRLYYFKQPWNVFDFVVVVFSILGLAVQESMPFDSPTLFRVVRVFRVGRILRLVKSARGIRTLLFSLAVSLPALFNIGLLLFLIMFIYAIFGMSFFMHVKFSAGIDNMFNFQTFDQSMMLLFQTATSAGWHTVLEALLIDEPDCNSTMVTAMPKSLAKGNCGSRWMAVLYLVTYLVISFLVIINMYIAVILENFSQATEDVAQGLTQDDFDLYYETWEKYDEKATEYIHLSILSDFVDSLEDPLRLPAPNYFKLISLDIPVYEGDLVHCVDILDALTKNFLGTSKDAAKELGDVKKGSGKKRYPLATSTMMRQREQMCAKLIQVAWRQHVEKRRAERLSIAEHSSEALKKRRNDILENIPEDSPFSSVDEDEEKEIFC